MFLTLDTSNTKYYYLYNKQHRRIGRSHSSSFSASFEYNINICSTCSITQNLKTQMIIKQR